MGELAKLPNIGKTIEQWLNEVGIETPEQLAAVGSKEAFLRIRARDPGACINLLRGLEGAVRGVRDTSLPDDVKADLLAFHSGMTK